jgi:glycosyltransferase involved in cell wall biosynthesis
MENIPLVSIVIPSFNSTEFINEAIDSCRRQTYKNIEIIVVDDASTDNTLEKLRAVEDVQLIINNENKGACYARNVGLELAHGEYIKFLDADDFLIKDCIERQVQRSEALCASEIAYGNFATLRNTHIGSFSNNVLVPGSIASIVAMDIIHTTTPLHRRNLLRKVSGFDERFKSSQEWNLHVRLTAIGVQFRYFNDDIMVYRIHDSKHRITTVRNKVKNIAYEKEKILETCRSVIDACDDDALAAFSFRIWDVGRLALQVGNYKMAQECFQQAVSLSPNDFKKYWRPKYKLAHSLLGAYATEKMFLLYRDWKMRHL